MSAFTGEHSFERVSQKISRYGTAKKMMISGSMQEEVRSPTSPGSSRVRCVHHLVLHEELKDQWQSDAAAQKKHSYHQMKRAMYGTRCASRLFQEHMKCVLGEAVYAALKVLHQ